MKVEGRILHLAKQHTNRQPTTAGLLEIAIRDFYSGRCALRASLIGDATSESVTDVTEPSGTGRPIRAAEKVGVRWKQAQQVNPVPPRIVHWCGIQHNILLSEKSDDAIRGTSR